MVENSAIPILFRSWCSPVPPRLSHSSPTPPYSRSSSSSSLSPSCWPYLGAAAKPKHSSGTIRARPWCCWRAQVSREVPHQVIVNIIMIIIIWMIVIALIITNFRLINIGDREDEEGIRWSFELCQRDQQRVILKVLLQKGY